MPNTLDPHPTNELGKGLLTASTEEWLLTNEFVYACRITHSDGSVVLRTSKRPIYVAVSEAHRQAIDSLRRQHTVNSTAPVEAG